MDSAEEGVVPGLERVMAVVDSSSGTRVAELLATSRFEVIPLDGVEEQVLAHVPVDVTVTITASPTKGLEPTFALAAGSQLTGTRSSRTSPPGSFATSGSSGSSSRGCGSSISTISSSSPATPPSRRASSPAPRSCSTRSKRSAGRSHGSASPATRRAIR